MFDSFIQRRQLVFMPVGQRRKILVGTSWELRQGFLDGLQGNRSVGNANRAPIAVLEADFGL